MTTMELFALAVGMAGVAEKIDEFAESFDVAFQIPTFWKLSKGYTKPKTSENQYG